RPQIMWYLDPIQAARTALQDNAGAQVALAFFPVLGLDGLQGVGGSVTMATEQFDSVVHTHLLLDNPRAGVVELLALKSGSTKPESWIPEEVNSYGTLHWDVNQTYTKLASLVDSFQGEGGFKNQVQGRLDDFDLDLEEDIIPIFDGRLTFATWIEPPARINSMSNIVGIRLKDAEKFQTVLDKLTDRFGENLDRKAFGGKTYYLVTPRNADEGEVPANRPCFCLFGDYLLVADRPTFLEKAMFTAGGGGKRLTDSVEFKLITNKIQRQPGGAKPAMISFQRPEAGLKWVYDMATSDNARQFLSDRAADNEVLRNLDQSLNNNPLPPFNVLKQYMAPAGSMITDDDTGI
ncbi:MAG: hypothetical protein N2C14_20740, partial [Planctomycetales bacterium]